MKYLLLLILLSSCSSIVRHANTSKVVVMDRHRQLIANNSTIQTTGDVRLTYIFLPFRSRGLQPRIYSYGDGKITYIRYVENHPDNTIPYFYYLVNCRVKTRMTILFVFEGKKVHGDKVLVHIEKIY